MELEVCCEEAEPPKLVELLFWLFVLSDSGKLNFIIYLGYSEINFSMDHGESTQFENSYFLHSFWRWWSSSWKRL